MVIVLIIERITLDLKVLIREFSSEKLSFKVNLLFGIDFAFHKTCGRT